MADMRRRPKKCVNQSDLPVCSNVEYTGGVLVFKQQGSSQCLHGVAEIVGLTEGKVTLSERSDGVLIAVAFPNIINLG